MSLDFSALESIPFSKAAEKAPADPEGKRYHFLEAEKKEREESREMYDDYQQNIRKAGMLRSDILKGLQRGEDPLEIILLATECISLMTGDPLIYAQSKEDIMTVYGWAPADLDRKKADPAETKEKIRKAISAHKDLIRILERELKE